MASINSSGRNSRKKTPSAQVSTRKSRRLRHEDADDLQEFGDATVIPVDKESESLKSRRLTFDLQSPASDSTATANMQTRTLQIKQEFKSQAKPTDHTSKIPRLNFGSIKNIFVAPNTCTPNFAKIHQKAFDKMDSIDVHIEKKKLRREQLKLNSLSSRSAASYVCHQLNNRKSIAKQTAAKEKSKKQTPVFVPTVVNTKDINFCFGNGNRDITSKRVTRANPNPSTGVSPFKFQNACVPAKIPDTKTKCRAKFDLQASLSKKLNYEPHRGRLKPLTDENAGPTSVAKIKRGEVRREVLREVVKGVRSNRRFELQLQSRGLRD